MLALAVGTETAYCQDFHYVEPGITSCPPAPAPSTAAPKVVARGVPISGSVNVSCGFDHGSYTVTMNSTDAHATFTPKTFIVNFGRIVGSGAFAVTFSTVGVQRISTSITSNMGSPALRGRFESAASEFDVVTP